jgi:hypothetical protein
MAQPRADARPSTTRQMHGGEAEDGRLVFRIVEITDGTTRVQ